MQKTGNHLWSINGNQLVMGHPYNGTMKSCTTEAATEHLNLILNFWEFSVPRKFLSMLGTNYVCESIFPN